MNIDDYRNQCIEIGKLRENMRVISILQKYIVEYKTKIEENIPLDTADEFLIYSYEMK